MFLGLGEFIDIDLGRATVFWDRKLKTQKDLKTDFLKP